MAPTPVKEAAHGTACWDFAAQQAVLPDAANGSPLVCLIKKASDDQQGITGLETAIVLIAFVVVASVFAFAVLSTSLVSSDKSDQAHQDALSEVSGTIVLQGDVTAEDTDTDGQVDKIYLLVATAGRGESINLAPGATLVRYSDASQSVMFDTAARLSVTPIGNADSDYLLERGEMFELALLDLETNLAPTLTKGKSLLIEVMPSKGAVLRISRATPIALTKYTHLTGGEFGATVGRDKRPPWPTPTPTPSGHPGVRPVQANIGGRRPPRERRL